MNKRQGVSFLIRTVLDKINASEGMMKVEYFGRTITIKNTVYLVLIMCHMLSNCLCIALAYH
jgi:hypothetical protein